MGEDKRKRDEEEYTFKPSDRVEIVEYAEDKRSKEYVGQTGTVDHLFKELYRVNIDNKYGMYFSAQSLKPTEKEAPKNVKKVTTVIPGWHDAEVGKGGYCNQTTTTNAGNERWVKDMWDSDRR